jgi:hypothetical protein
MVRNMNDGTANAPALRADINYANVKGLPPYSTAPRGDDRALHQAVKDAGYRGIQGGIPELCRELGLGVTDGGRINVPADADATARDRKARGFECATVHVGWGMEDDDQAFRLIDAVISASVRHDFPLYIETHRATITQDLWRTVQFARQFPEVRFNGDFSHWYTGLEMVYGDFDAKLDFLAPVFERVRFFHGRIGVPGSIQAGVGDGTGRANVGHFREMWTRGMLGFLRTARPGDVLCFAPELLGPEISYARLIPGADGALVEESDRWQQAAVLTRIAGDCWEEAGRRLSRAGGQAAAY